MSLVTNRFLQYAYERTDKFWLNWLRDEFPTSEGWLMGVNQPADDGDGRDDRPDIIFQQVERGDGGVYSVTRGPTVMFLRTRGSGSANDLRAVERHAKRSAVNFMRAGGRQVV